jgi:hypothetical protein
MTGWHTGQARDTAARIASGALDRDLAALLGAIYERQAIRRYGPCPVCGEPLIEEHTHGDLQITRVWQPS